MKTTESNNGGSLERVVRPLDRKLIVAFFQLGTLSRYEICAECGLLTESDVVMEPQTMWATAFQRAVEQDKLEALADAIRKRPNDPSSATGREQP
jgi:hypothetical protein